MNASVQIYSLLIIMFTWSSCVSTNWSFILVHFYPFWKQQDCTVGCSRWDQMGKTQDFLWFTHIPDGWGFLHRSQTVHETLWLSQNGPQKVSISFNHCKSFWMQRNPIHLVLRKVIKQRSDYFLIQFWMRLNRRAAAESLWPLNSFPLSFQHVGTFTKS